MGRQVMTVEKPLAKARRRLARGQGVRGSGQGPLMRWWTIEDVDKATREDEELMGEMALEMRASLNAA